jgi:hypothetical protein
MTWCSDATSVATVDATTGVVTAVAAGTANITATANDGSGVTATCAVTVTIPPVSTYLTDGAMVVVEFVDEYGEHTSVGGEYSNGLGAFTSVDYNRDGGTLTKNGNIIHAWVKSSHESEATIDINITNNTYTVSFVNGSVMFTGLSSVFIGDTNVKNLLTRVTN